MVSSSGSLNWQLDAECAKPENSDTAPKFFSNDPEDKNDAKNLCYTCDVRKDCVIWAVESNTIWGVWGARDENELRRILSLNAEGNEVKKARAPQCPYCSARTSRLFTKIIDLPDGGRWTTAKMVECSSCGVEWRSRSSANAVNSYHLARAQEDVKLIQRAIVVAHEELEAAQVEVSICEQVKIAAHDEHEIQKLLVDSGPSWDILKAARKAYRMALGVPVRIEAKIARLREAEKDAIAWVESGPTRAKK